jgi:phosphonoacetaldehyde hydrolase
MPPARIRAVVLDVAGTVVDFGSRAPLLALRELFGAAAAGRTALRPTDAVLRAPMGLPKREHIREVCRALGLHDLPDPQLDALHGRFAASITTWAARRNRWAVPAVPGVLSSLRGAGIGVGFCSGYDRTTLAPFERLLAEAFGPGHGMPVVCASDGLPGRPHPDMALRVAELLGAQPSQCLKVGDTVADMREGCAAGMRSVGVLDSGNEVGLDAEEWYALAPDRREAMRRAASKVLLDAGAAATIRTVRELVWLV